MYISLFLLSSVDFVVYKIIMRYVQQKWKLINTAIQYVHAQDNRQTTYNIQYVTPELHTTGA